jgi:hypothetical protein
LGEIVAMATISMGGAYNPRMERMLGALLLAVAALAGGCSSSATSPADAGAASEAASDGPVAAEAGDTWDSWAQGFFTKYCASCHTASDPTGRNYTLKTDVVHDKLEIRCGVSATQDPSWACSAFPPAKQFPIDNATKTNPKPTDAERARAVAWITAGCP